MAQAIRAIAPAHLLILPVMKSSAKALATMRRPMEAARAVTVAAAKVRTAGTSAARQLAAALAKAAAEVVVVKLETRVPEAQALDP